MKERYFVKFGRHYLLSEEKRTDRHTPRLNLVETQQMATWFDAKQAKELEKQYGGRAIKFNATVEW